MCVARMSNSAGSDETARTILYRRVPRVKYNPRHRQHQPRGDYPNAVVHALEKDRDLYFHSSALAQQVEEIREANGSLRERISELERENEYLRETCHNNAHQIAHLERGLQEVIEERDHICEKTMQKDGQIRNAHHLAARFLRERDHYKQYWKKAKRAADQLFNTVADEQDSEQKPEGDTSSSSASHDPMS